MEESNIEKNTKSLWQFIAGKIGKLIFILFGVSLLLILLYEPSSIRAFYDLLSDNKCDSTDVNCFILAADNCENAKLLLTDDETGLFMEYFSIPSSRSFDSCVLIKRIISLDQNEPEEIKNLLTDKSFICDYTKGNFDEEWIFSLISGTEKCQGRLREALDQLILAI